MNQEHCEWQTMATSSSNGTKWNERSFGFCAELEISSAAGADRELAFQVAARRFVSLVVILWEPPGSATASVKVPALAGFPNEWALLFYLFAFDDGRVLGAGGC